MNEIKIPQVVKVGGLDYAVKADAATDIQLRADSCWGQRNTWLQIIRLRQDLQPQGLSQTFIHEVIEAVSSVYLNESLKDETIEPLSQGLTQVFEQLSVRFVL